MSRIVTRLVKDKAHSDRVSLYLDDHYYGTTSLELVYRFQLHVGKIVSDELISMLVNAANLLEAKSVALRYLGTRAQSKQGIIQYLKRKEFSESVISDTVEFLIRQGFINDTTYAASFINSRLHHKPRGRRLIRYELLKRGISEEDIDSGMTDATISEAESACTLIRKRINRLSSDHQQEWIEKTIRWLLSKGFSYSLARNSIEKVLRELEEPV